jgi:hypothetical protein
MRAAPWPLAGTGGLRSNRIELRGRLGGGGAVKPGWTFGLTVLVALSTVTAARAQVGQLTANVNYTGTIDCDQPKQVKALQISGRGVARMSQDKHASLDMSTQGFTSSHTRFEATLGGTPAVAPGGTASLRVMSSSQLRLVWDLPNHSMIVNVRMTPTACTLNVDFRLRGGALKYSMFSNGAFYFCSRPKISSMTCTVK